MLSSTSFNCLSYSAKKSFVKKYLFISVEKSSWAESLLFDTDRSHILMYFGLFTMYHHTATYSSASSTFESVELKSSIALHILSVTFCIREFITHLFWVFQNTVIWLKPQHSANSHRAWIDYCFKMCEIVIVIKNYIMTFR